MAGINGVLLNLQQWKGWVISTFLNIVWKSDSNPCLSSWVLWNYILAQSISDMLQVKKSAISFKTKRTVQTFSGDPSRHYDCSTVVCSATAPLVANNSDLTVHQNCLICSSKPSILPPSHLAVMYDVNRQMCSAEAATLFLASGSSLTCLMASEHHYTHTENWQLCDLPEEKKPPQAGSRITASPAAWFSVSQV